MSINLSELLKQRAEATGVDGDRVPFQFGGKTFTFRDPLMLSDDEKDELADLDFDVDVAAWYMGDDQYDEFVATTETITLDGGESFDVTGSSSVFFTAFKQYMEDAREEDANGRPTSRNRSSRRMEARKQRKQR